MKRIMEIIDENNNRGKYEIFCTFNSDITNKDYVVYAELEEDEDGMIEMHAGTYIQEGDILIVDTRLTHEENKTISVLVKNIIEQVKKIKE